MHHPQVRSTEARVVEHDHARLARDADIPRLLTQLPNRSLLSGFPGIDEAGRDLDADFVKGRTVLLLEDDLWARGFAQHREDADAVNVTVLGAGGAFSMLPCARHAIGVLIGGSATCESG